MEEFIKTNITNINRLIFHGLCGNDAMFHILIQKYGGEIYAGFDPDYYTYYGEVYVLHDQAIDKIKPPTTWHISQSGDDSYYEIAEDAYRINISTLCEILKRLSCDIEKVVIKDVISCKFNEIFVNLKELSLSYSLCNCLKYVPRNLQHLKIKNIMIEFDNMLPVSGLENILEIKKVDFYFYDDAKLYKKHNNAYAAFVSKQEKKFKRNMMKSARTMI